MSDGGGFGSGNEMGKGEGENQVSKANTPQRIGPLTPPSPLSCTSLTPPRSPLPDMEAPCLSLATTEPRRLGLVFGSNSPLPPRAPLDWVDPGPEPRLTPPKSNPHYPNSSFPHVIREYRAPVARFSIFSPKLLPPRAPLDRADPGPKPRLTPPQSTSHYPNPRPPAHRSRKLSPWHSIFDF